MSELQRSLGVWQAAAVSIGAIIGARDICPDRSCLRIGRTCSYSFIYSCRPCGNVYGIVCRRALFIYPRSRRVLSPG